MEFRNSLWRRRYSFLQSVRGSGETGCGKTRVCANMKSRNPQGLKLGVFFGGLAAPFDFAQGRLEK